MKRLIAILAMLLLGPAMAQEVIPGPYIQLTPTNNLVPDFSFDSPVGTIPSGWTQTGPPGSGGSVQGGCGALSNQGQCYKWSFQGGYLSTNIDLTSYNTNSLLFNFDFFYRMNCNNNIGGYCENVNGVEDSFSATVKFFTNNGLYAQFDFIPLSTDYFTVGYPNTNNLGYRNPTFSDAVSTNALFTSAQISFYGKDNGFWAGYYGPSLDRVNFRFDYLPTVENPYPFWSPLAQEWGTFTLNETSTVRYGGEGFYAYATLQPGTYACNNFEFGIDPVGGIVKSCEAGTLTDPNPQTDCSLYPTDPNCAVLVYTDPALIADTLVDEVVADATTNDTTDETLSGSDDGSDDGTEVVEEEEEVLVANEDNTDLEEMLSDDEESTDEEETATVTETTTATNEPQTTYRELTDEEKAQILADSIAKSTLEMALSIAETSIASTVISTTETTVTSSSRTNTSNEIETNDDEEKADTMEQQLADNGSETANDLLETGRSLNAASLAQTQTQTELSASDSILQAESIAISSSEIRGSDTIIESISIENVLDNSSVANSGSSDSETNIEPTVSTTETVVEEVLVSNIEQSIETSSETVDSFNDIMNIEIKPTDTTLDDVEFVQNVLAQSEQKSEENISAFEEDEKVTIQNDPNLANAFNVVPNTTNLELAGVLGNNKDEKSDAEKRAEEVVAANKEQQDEINKNYMDADQSGIVAAMGSDTDVSSYRSAMLRDNNIWYKPEDIYKNVVYKDNVRGAYFLEKGNTDTYKKMVEEQYK